MELEAALPVRSTTKNYQIPPDVNTGDSLFTQQRWYSRLAIPVPVVYGIHLAAMLVFGILSIVFGILSDGLRKPRHFWEFFPEFLSALAILVVTTLVHFTLLPAFWRAQARQMIDEGYFDSSTRGYGKRRLVLQIGCSDGATSAAFARAIIERQRDVGNLTAPYASLPTFIGYDKWSPWSRLPNTPACFLSTLMQAGVPRESIIANRMDTTSKESKTTLPYPSGSISLVICNVGLSELLVKSEEKTLLLRELVRVLEPEGRMIIVEHGGVGKRTSKTLWRRTAPTYKHFLVEEMGWEQESVTIGWRWCIQYLVAVKPSGMSKTV